MKIRIREDAKSAYVNDIRNFWTNWEWAALLEKLQGMTLEVETDFLFRDQFNVGPVPGISEGLRIMNNSVAEVIDDVRNGKMRCQWCGKCSDVADVCPHCGKSEYREMFNIIKWVEVMHNRKEFDKNKLTRRMRTRHMPTREEMPPKGRGSYDRNRETDVDPFVADMELAEREAIREFEDYMSDVFGDADDFFMGDN
jgi:stalled ribosome alternative rescue factor ArfA